MRNTSDDTGMDDASVDAEELFRELKREAESIPASMASSAGKHDDDASNVSRAMSKYDHDIFLEILGLDHVEAGHRIDKRDLAEFRQKLDNYMDAQAPGLDVLKKYVRIISTYLVFIARRPLHSPDIAFFQNKKITKKNNVYYCPAKKIYIKEKDSLCRYCVCKAEK